MTDGNLHRDSQIGYPQGVRRDVETTSASTSPSTRVAPSDGFFAAGSPGSALTRAETG